MKLLLTAFEPFGKLRVNASEEVVKKIVHRNGRSHACEIIAQVLPTEYSASAGQIRRLIRKHRPDALLCLGVAAARDAICLERFALNVDEEKLPDNAGRIASGKPIRRGGPEAYRSTLPIDKMLRALQRRRIRARISNSAGTFVCNHAFYVARDEVERLGLRIPCGFIHVPDLKGRRRRSRGMPLSKMVLGIECCIGILGSSLEQ